MEQRNMILAFVLSVAILLGWSMMFPEQHVQTQQADNKGTVQPQKNAAPQPPVQSTTPVAPTEASAMPTVEPPADSGKTVSIANDLLKLKINDKGWVIGATLLDYKDSIEANSPHVEVLGSDEENQRRSYMNDGLVGATANYPFKVVSESKDKLVLQTGLDGGGLWTKTISLKAGSYEIGIQDRISHGANVRLYRQVVERNPNKKLKTFYEHVGPIALVKDKLQEVGYDDLDKKGQIQMASTGGWTGVMNRYFITALIANPKQNYPYYFKSDGRSYQAGLIDDGTAEKSDKVFRGTVFIGPKSIPLLESLGVGLERSVDFGWFAFIAKPMHTFLLWIYHYIGNFGWCIIVLVVLIKLIFFWPTKKSYESMAGMRKLQPEIARLKETHGDDRQQMSQEMMKLYKKHQVNPLGGCLPIAVQIPVFFSLYKVLLMSIEMRQAPFIGWIHDMSVKDPYYVLPVLMGLSMFVQQKLNPKPADPMQAKIMQFLPPVFTVMFLSFPAGLVLYWFVNNILSIAQQWYVLKVKKAL